MITIYLGEDTARSREEFSYTKSEYKKKNTTIYDITAENIAEIPKWLGESQSLFDEKKVFFAENILSKKENREILKEFDAQNSAVSIYIWEEKMEERVAKFLFKYAKLNSYKISTSIFTFLDSFVPENLSLIHTTFLDLLKTNDENMVFYMIAKRLRELILIKSGIAPAKLASWQLARLKAQAVKWDTENLLKFYDHMYRLDVNNKSSKGYYNLTKSLDILFCYYVR